MNFLCGNPPRNHTGTTREQVTTEMLALPDPGLERRQLENIVLVLHKGSTTHLIANLEVITNKTCFKCCHGDDKKKPKNCGRQLGNNPSGYFLRMRRKLFSHPSAISTCSQIISEFAPGSVYTFFQFNSPPQSWLLWKTFL